MPTDQQVLDEIERKLAVHAPSLAAEYRAAVLEVEPVLSEADFRMWAEEGVELAGSRCGRGRRRSPDPIG